MKYTKIGFLLVLLFLAPFLLEFVSEFTYDSPAGAFFNSGPFLVLINLSFLLMPLIAVAALIIGSIAYKKDRSAFGAITIIVISILELIASAFTLSIIYTIGL